MQRVTPDDRVRPRLRGQTPSAAPQRPAVARRSRAQGRARRWDTGPAPTARDLAALRFVGEQYAVRADVAREAERRHGRLGPFTADELGTLVASAFFGSESLLLLGFDREVLPIRSALRRVGALIRQHEEGPTAPGRTEDAGMPTAR